MDKSVLVDRSLGLSKVITKPGVGVQCPREGAQVTVRIEPAVSQDAETKTFVVGEGDTMLGEYLDSLTLTMKRGEICQCPLPAGCFASGKDAAGSVEATVTLISMPSAPLPFSPPSPQDNLDRAIRLKDRASALAKASDWWLAARRYSRATRSAILGLTVENLDEELRVELLDVRTKCHLNLAMCQLNLNDLPRAVKNCDHVLQQQPDNVKARYRRGRALTGINEFERAELDFKHAQSLEPDNKLIAKQYEHLKTRMQKQDQYYHQALKSMFGAK